MKVEIWEKISFGNWEFPESFSESSFREVIRETLSCRGLRRKYLQRKNKEYV